MPSEARVNLWEKNKILSAKETNKVVLNWGIRALIRIQDPLLMGPWKLLGKHFKIDRINLK